MRLSRHFLPVLKESPTDAQIVSHKLMLRAGLVRQTAAGIYAWLPLGLRVLRKIEQIVREEQDRAGAIELLMPTLQSADLWRESGRYDAYGPEMLRIKDRHDREMLYGPTNEEMITSHLPRERAQLPRPAAHALPHPVEVPRRGPPALRRDARPRVPDEGRLQLRRRRGGGAAQLQPDVRRLSATPMRGWGCARSRCRRTPGRSAAISATSSSCSRRPARATSSITATGRSVGRACRRSTSTTSKALQAIVSGCTADYAATDEKRDPAAEADAGEALRQSRGVEVGHIFYFGEKYSKPMGLEVQGSDGSQAHPAHGQLRDRRVAAGGRDHRGEPRRCRHHLARFGGALCGRADQHARRRRELRSGGGRSSTRRLGAASRAGASSTTTATSAAAPSSRRWT